MAVRMSCPVCQLTGQVIRRELGHGYEVTCQRCGDFFVTQTACDDLLPLRDTKEMALASHLIRRLQGGKTRPVLREDFLASLSEHRLPTPAEISDNLLLMIDQRVEGRPGPPIFIDYRNDYVAAASIGAVGPEDVLWALGDLSDRKLLAGKFGGSFSDGRLTAEGWQRVEELKRTHKSSRYAFLARQFKNPDLDALYETCLRPAVADTGFDLLPVTQKAGHIDAIIEDEIRRGRFLIADLSDGNAGAYWEAGFAEGLGKPVIYICRKGVDTHFDTNHRQTVRWDPATPEEAARQLKAVIRNTLLGDAKQED